MIDLQVYKKYSGIFEQSPALLDALLRDCTLSSECEQVNIFWASDIYAGRGENYQYNDQITVNAISGVNEGVIVPRALKSRDQQQYRIREMAEVFTPSWMCNKQNNLIDAAWFGRDDVFNKEIDSQGGRHTWSVNNDIIVFPEGRTWRDYINETSLEIACGEAPYLVSRYDTVTGEPISIERRIGLLDRKLRVVNENTLTESEWLLGARLAYQSTYGFEWQGDNLVLARENLLFTFIENYKAKFDRLPAVEALLDIAYIIAWNIWQMDGLKGVIPDSCHCVRETVDNLFSSIETIHECEGCKKGDLHRHSGVYCKIRDWKTDEIVTFVSLLKHG